MPDLEVLLAAWGAFLSTVLAIDQFRQRSRNRVSLAAEWEATKDELQVEIVNAGPTAITVRSVELIYGETESAAALVHVVSAESCRLEAGALKDWVIPRDTFIDAPQRARLQIGRRNYAWVRASLFGVGTKLAAVVIDPKAIGASGYYTPAEDNIAADLFVGFSKDLVLSQKRNLVYRHR